MKKIISKHTPGSWLIQNTTKDYIFIYSDAGGDIAEIYNHSERPKKEVLANARLIAMAPNMFECLKAIQNRDVVDIDEIFNLVDAILLRIES